jgi:hypothetical protein
MLDFSLLKGVDRDKLLDAVRLWDARKELQFDAEALRDRSVRDYYKARFTYRKNLLDWNFQSNVKGVLPCLRWTEYRDFGLLGQSYETVIGQYTQPNRTLAAYTRVTGRDRLDKELLGLGASETKIFLSPTPQVLD